MKIRLRTLNLTVAALTAFGCSVFAGEIFSTGFDQDSAGEVIYEDHGLDMSLKTYIGGGAKKSHWWLNNNDHARQSLTILSGSATFESGKTYTIEFEARKAINTDPEQEEVTVSAGSFSKDIAIQSRKQVYSVNVDADKEGIVGQPLAIKFQADGTTREGVNQYWILGVTISED